MEFDSHPDQNFQVLLAQLPMLGLEPWSWDTDFSKAATRILLHDSTDEIFILTSIKIKVILRQTVIKKKLQSRIQSFAIILIEYTIHNSSWLQTPNSINHHETYRILTFNYKHQLRGLATCPFFTVFPSNLSTLLDYLSRRYKSAAMSNVSA